jgi:predicted nucleotidyltransferase
MSPGASLESAGGVNTDPSDKRSAEQAPTEMEKRENVLRLAFGGNTQRFHEFLRVLRDETPDGTSVVLRGSAVTGRRWKDGAPFDADGPGTSDLDLTLVGEKAIGLFDATGFFVPGVHSRPVSDDDPDIAPSLIPLRDTLMVLVGRPVNIQASREIVIRFRGDLLGQPYLLLIDGASGETCLPQR